MRVQQPVSRRVNDGEEPERADDQDVSLDEEMRLLCREPVSDENGDVGLSGDPGFCGLADVTVRPLPGALHLVEEASGAVPSVRADLLKDVPALTRMGETIAAEMGLEECEKRSFLEKPFGLCRLATLQALFKLFDPRP